MLFYPLQGQKLDLQISKQALMMTIWDLYVDAVALDEQDDNLYIDRWMKLISMPDQPDFIQIISWNDYGESHYIGPRLGTPPADTTWLLVLDQEILESGR